MWPQILSIYQHNYTTDEQYQDELQSVRQRRIRRGLSIQVKTTTNALTRSKRSGKGPLRLHGEGKLYLAGERAN